MRRQWHVPVFDEGNMIGIKDSVGSGIPQAVSLRVWGIPYQQAGLRAMVNLRIVGRNEGECFTANLPKVKYRWSTAIP